MRTLRRYWLQFAAVGVVVATLLVLWVAGGHGGSSASGGPAGASSTSAAVATPTADPREEQVRQAAMNYVAAGDDAFKSGSPDQLDTLTVPGSQARGDAGVAANIVRHTHRTFLVSQVHYLSLSVNVVGSSATAHVSYDLLGYDAAWPSLQRLGPDRTMKDQSQDLDMQLIEGTWLVNSER